MSFFSICGSEIVGGAKFCQKCGAPVANANTNTQGRRVQEFEGKIYKCPNCGETLRSFVRNCPTCGFELRGTKATSAVREFALKLEAIESRREYERPRGLFSRTANLDRIAKTDEQKISLIQSFSVPNTKEDMLEFMILATSNVNMRSYDSTNTNISKSEKAINDAWMSKIKQVYEKAKRSYGYEEDFQQIQSLYDGCNADIKNAKKKGVVKWILMFAWIPAIFIIIALSSAIFGPGAEKKEVARLESIEQVAIEALENGEYKKALLNAEGLEYKPGIRNGNADEIERQWDIKRELLIDEILEEAEKNGVHLERTPTDEGSEDEDNKTGGFIEGFKEGAQPGLDAAKENIDEFNRIMEEGKNSDSSATSGDQKGE